MFLAGAVLLNSLESIRPTRFLWRKQVPAVSPLDSTLVGDFRVLPCFSRNHLATTPLFSALTQGVPRKPFRICTCEKQGEGVLLLTRHATKHARPEPVNVW